MGHWRATGSDGALRLMGWIPSRQAALVGRDFSAVSVRPLLQLEPPTKLEYPLYSGAASSPCVTQPANEQLASRIGRRIRFAGAHFTAACTHDESSSSRSTSGDNPVLVIGENPNFGQTFFSRSLRRSGQPSKSLWTNALSGFLAVSQPPYGWPVAVVNCTNLHGPPAAAGSESRT